MEDIVHTPDEVRHWQQSLQERGIEQWTLYLRELATGELAGFTAVYWDPERPEQLDQGDTGVFPEFRNQGLGTWLKAAMLEKVLHERPQVRRVRTRNAQSNAAMLSINNQLGFKPYFSLDVWQVSIERVRLYLQGRTVSG
jgi:RimJ/RimL family protein N-acetyltransferase